MEAGLKGQNTKWLKHWLEHNRTQRKNIGKWIKDAKTGVKVDKVYNEAADKHCIGRMMYVELPGYMRMRYSKVNNPALIKGNILKR